MPLLDGHDPAAVAAAAQRLADGGLVAFPTETVYGLGARADDDAAVGAIFTAKGRPADHPLIVHLADGDGAAAFAADWPPLAARLAAAFWPGPLTLIVPRRPGVAEAASGRQPTIGLRCPSHAVAHRLLAQAKQRGVPGLAGPSANRYGRVSPTTAAHVVAEFGPSMWVLDGGACEVGIESAIVEVVHGRAVLLRPGVLTPSALAEAAGQPLQAPDGTASRAPGTKTSHYAPQARVRLLTASALAARLADARPPGVAVYSRTAVPRAGGAMQRAMPATAPAAARELFAALREFDQRGASEVWVEEPPDDPSWDGVRDRLRRAAFVDDAA